ncbi:hypothetical protein VTN31DRAFT_369 [Thermomyces dupontii]|uniref:uncharacterized protein n=1 Tax=Talaromyces thermophilus TaxID=28565 RepID=UPI0037445386
MDATLQKFLTPLDQLLSTATLICVLQDIGLVSAALICLVLSVLLYNYIQSPLKSFPGPTATKFTNLWRLLNTANGNVHLTQMELHRKYGPAVRMGPNTLSVSDSTVIKTVYNASKPWTKSPMYQVQESSTPDGKFQPNLFSTADEKWHSFVLKPIGSFFTASSILSLEELLDRSINDFIQILTDRFADKKISCDMADYIMFFAWDSMGYVTFGEPLGFTRDPCPRTRKLLKCVDDDFDYFAAVSQLPQIGYLFKRNPIPQLRPPQLDWAVQMGFEYYKQRQSAQETKPSDQPADLLDKYLEVQRKHPDLVDDNQMISYLLTNTVAGSDPTAYTVTALVYYVLRAPNIYQALQEELDRAQLTVPVSWKEARNLPYLTAVIHETLRVHPAIALMLERMVPEGGFHLPDGRTVPAGAVIGLNPWVVNRDEAVFGSDVDTFDPSRWLQKPTESNEQFESRRKRMVNTLLSFGVGPRVCLGRHIAMMEIYKSAASLFAKFHMELAQPDQEWKVTNSWVLRTENVPVMVRSKQ